MTNLSEVNKKFLAGKPLSDGELNSLLDNYFVAATFLDKIDDSAFFLFRWEINRRLEILEGFKREREL